MTKDKDNYPQVVKAIAKTGVKSSIDRGAVIVKDSHGRPIRLSWDKKDQAGEIRPLAPGEYKVVGYRVEQKTKDGTEWMLTASSANFAKLTVEQGKVVDVPVPKTISQAGRLMSRGGSTQVNMALNFGRGGVTIYRNGERIPMPFRVVNAAGRTVGKGSIEYG